jgi:hypothetical protein
MEHFKKDAELIAQWEDIAMKAIRMNGLSRSEVSAIEVGITRSKNQKLKDIIAEMKTKAWKAKVR